MDLTILVYPLLALLLLWGAKLAKRGEFFEDYTSLKTAKCIQGFAAVGVIVHHLAQRFSNYAALDVPLKMFNDLGFYFVSIFFFFSGLGLIKSLRSNERYLDGFLWKRLVVILVPYYLINLTYILSNILIGHQHYGLGRFISDLVGFSLVTGDGWYPVTAVILYIEFYLLFKTVKSFWSCFTALVVFVFSYYAFIVTASLLYPLIASILFLAFFLLYKFVKREWVSYAALSVFVLGYCVFVILMRHGDGSTLFQGEWWCNSTPAFVLGLFWARFEGKITSFAKKNYVWLMPITVALAVGGWFLNIYALNNISYWNEYSGYPGYAEKFACLGIQAIAAPLFIIAILLIGMKLKVGNKALAFLGTLTLEIYLIQRHFISLFNDAGVIKNDLLCTLAVAVCSVLAAWLMHLLCGVIKKPLLKSKALTEKVSAEKAEAAEKGN